MEKEINDDLIFIGGIGENLWLDDGKKHSRNFKQGYRVYDSKGIAVAITANGGGLGRNSGLYLIRKEVEE